VLDCTAKFAFEVPNVPAGNYGIVLVGWTSYGVGPPWVAYSGDVPEVLHVRALPDTATDAPGAWLERQGLPARLIGDDGRILRLGGWPAGGRS